MKVLKLLLVSLAIMGCGVETNVEPEDQDSSVVDSSFEDSANKNDTWQMLFDAEIAIPLDVSIADAVTDSHSDTKDALTDAVKDVSDSDCHSKCFHKCEHKDD